MYDKNVSTILDFLNMPLYRGDEVYEKFANLPNAIVGKGEEPLQRYVFIPGTKKNKIVLIAHIDTVWDKSYDRAFLGERSVEFKDGIFYSTNLTRKFIEKLTSTAL